MGNNYLNKPLNVRLSTGCPMKKVSIKKLLVRAAHDFNSQFLNLFGFSISVSFVWCII